MKKLLVAFMCILLVASAMIPEAMGQDRRRRSRFGRKARTATIIGGGAIVGGLLGGGKGAAIGAGGATAYAMNRKAARQHFKRRTRTVATTGGTALAGAGVGGALGGKRAATAGAIVGGTGGYLYSRSHRARHRF